MRRFVSIHAPGRGATAKWTREEVAALVSIHAPGRGATLLLSRFAPLSVGFNSRTREGCDSMVQSCVLWGG